MSKSKKIFFLWFLSYVLPLHISSGQAPAMTRMIIPNTTISLIPPANFIPSDFYDGLLHKPTSSSIIGKKEPGQGYLHFNKRFTPGYLQALGLQMIKKEDIKTSEMEGTLYLLTYVVQNTNMHRYMLVTGDEQNTYFVMANYPAGYKSRISEPIKRSLMTVQYK